MADREVDERVVEILSKYLRRSEEEIVEACLEAGITKVTDLAVMSPEEIAEWLDIKLETAKKIERDTMSAGMGNMDSDSEGGTAKSRSVKDTALVGGFIPQIALMHACRGALPVVLKGGSFAGR
ncbi:hypothetical protein [Methanopyrus sp.]